ncbi:MAG: TAXI family TRAP transporter solute-binding subunit [Pseudomonadota bacterium]
MNVLARGLFAALVTSALTPALAQADTFVRMVSGPSGGSWYPLGAKIMQVMEENIDGIATSNTSGGGISNVLSVNGGDAEVGFSYAHTTANGFNGVGKFNSKQEDVRHFATLYGSMFQVAVRADSDIKSFKDMAGANISPGKAKWTGTAFAESILSHYGITFDSIKQNGGTVHHVNYTESVALMKDGHIDVFMAATNMPQASMLELEQSPGIRFIGLPKADQEAIIASNPGYIEGVMPAGVYQAVTEDLNSLGIVVNMVVHKDLPEDLVYNMCKIFWANHGTFAEVKSVWNRVKQEDALSGVAIPVHPGAEKCYKELGVTG